MRASAHRIARLESHGKESTVRVTPFFLGSSVLAVCSLASGLANDSTYCGRRAISIEVVVDSWSLREGNSAKKAERGTSLVSACDSEFI